MVSDSSSLTATVAAVKLFSVTLTLSALVNTGASFAAVVTRSKVSVPVAPLASVAVTVIVLVPA